MTKLYTIGELSQIFNAKTEKIKTTHKHANYTY